MKLAKEAIEKGSSNVRTQLINQNLPLASSVGNYSYLPTTNCIRKAVFDFKQSNSDLITKLLMLQDIYKNEGECQELKGYNFVK